MTEQNWLARSGATPGKLAAIGILGLVLVTVIWRNVAGSSPTKPAKASHPSTSAKAETALAKPASKPQAAISKRIESETPRVWPQVSLEQTVKHDPFALPMWYLMAQADEAGSPGAAIAKSAQVLEELKRQQTKIVVISSEDRVATIGERSYRVGDMIEGFKVTAITTEGIVLTETSR